MLKLMRIPRRIKIKIIRKIFIACTSIFWSKITVKAIKEYQNYILYQLSPAAKQIKRHQRV